MLLSLAVLIGEGLDPARYFGEVRIELGAGGAGTLGDPQELFLREIAGTGADFGFGVAAGGFGR